jgi:hypothetical protein
MSIQFNKRYFLRNLSNIPGKSVSRKIVVIESDDWGAVRMASKEAYNKLWNTGVRPSSTDEARYLENDALASEQDLVSLFEVLSSVKDKNRNSAIFTVVGLVANPDFDKIRENNFEQYYYEPFNVTLKRYPEHRKSFDLWKEGIVKRLFVPQFHGREHLNVCSWLKALRNGNSDTLAAFENRVYGITPRHPINNISYQAAFDIDELKEIEYQKSVLREGLELFEQLFGYKARFFVPTNGPFNNSLEEVLHECGIKYIGASKIQKEPLGKGKLKKQFHYIGQKNSFGQIYITRNCFFEPTSNLKTDWIDSCLNEIRIAFRWKKPAVISSHRVNYIGFINRANRDRGLFQLNDLLSQIVNQWPDVEFMTSDELGDLIVNKS